MATAILQAVCQEQKMRRKSQQYKHLRRLQFADPWVMLGGERMRNANLAGADMVHPHAWSLPIADQGLPSNLAAEGEELQSRRCIDKIIQSRAITTPDGDGLGCVA